MKIKSRKEKQTVAVMGIISMIVIILLSSSFVYIAFINSNTENQNKQLMSDISTKNSLIDQYIEDMAPLDQDLNQQYTKLEMLNDENIRLYNDVIRTNEDITYRDTTISDRDTTICSLSDDLLLLKQDIQEAKSRVESPYPPYIVGTIEKTVLIRFLRNFTGPDAYIYAGDGVYNLTTLSELERFLAWDCTDEYQYEARTFDCDDFSAHLHGMISIPGWSSICFGKICSRSSESSFHVYNVFIAREDESLVLYKVEPQTDKVERIVSLEDVKFITFS